MLENTSVPQLALFAWEADMICAPNEFAFSFERSDCA